MFKRYCTYTSTAANKLFFDENFVHVSASGFTVGSVLRNQSMFQQFLIRNLSLPNDTASLLLSSPINLKEVCLLTSTSFFLQPRSDSSDFEVQIMTQHHAPLSLLPLSSSLESQLGFAAPLTILLHDNRERGCAIESNALGQRSSSVTRFNVSG